MQSPMTMEFSISDVRELAETILADFKQVDNSGSFSRHGLWYCQYCGKYDYEEGKGFEHDQDCVTKIAQDVLTRLPS